MLTRGPGGIPTQSSGIQRAGKACDHSANTHKIPECKLIIPALWGCEGHARCSGTPSVTVSDRSTDHGAPRGTLTHTTTYTVRNEFFIVGMASNGCTTHPRGHATAWVVGHYCVCVGTQPQHRRYPAHTKKCSAGGVSVNRQHHITVSMPDGIRGRDARVRTAEPIRRRIGPVVTAWSIMLCRS